MNVQEYHKIVIERLNKLYHELPIEYCGYAMTAIEDIEAEYYSDPNNPYTIGYNLYKSGKGISDIWGAVKCDEDMKTALDGYNDAKTCA